MSWHTRRQIRQETVDSVALDAEPAKPTASFLRSVKMVGWSFLGIRKNSEYQQDLASVNPLHIILAAFGGVLVFVVGLVLLVNWIAVK